MQVRYLGYWQPEKGKFREFPTLYEGTIPYHLGAGTPIRDYVRIYVYYAMQMCPVVEAVITEQLEFD